jgi:TDG/mug DNA glycosylase family protein
MVPRSTLAKMKKTIPASERYTKVQYKITHNTKLLLIGANPSPGTYRRGIPFSNNKTLWYLLHDAGLIDEDRTILKDDKNLKKIYQKKFTQVYQLGLLNIANRPTKTFMEIKQAETIPEALRIIAAIKKYQPLVVCFIGKRTFQLFAQKSSCRYGWQPNIDASRIYVMHTPLHGLARVRINELKKVGKAAGLL